MSDDNGDLRFGVIDENRVVVNGSVRPRCTATRKDGLRCQGFVVQGTEMCRFHLNQIEGKPMFGSLTAQEAAQKAAEQSKLRVELRKTLMPVISSPRGALRLAVAQNAAKLAHRVLDESLDPANGVKGATLALKAITEADPRVEASITYTGPVPQTREEMEAMRPEEFDAFMRSQLPALP